MTRKLIIAAAFTAVLSGANAKAPYCWVVDTKDYGAEFCQFEDGTVFKQLCDKGHDTFRPDDWRACVAPVEDHGDEPRSTPHSPPAEGTKGLFENVSDRFP